MTKEPALWMYETLKDCCTAYYGWEAGFIECMSSQGGDAPTQSPIEESWYVDWQEFKCVESCEGDKPCVEVSITLGMNSTHRRRIVVRLVYSGETLMTALMTSKEQVERDGLYCCVSDEFVAYLDIYWYNN